jgi:hypothetical protein
MNTLQPYMVQSGMERGIVDGHNRLDELLEKGF